MPRRPILDLALGVLATMAALVSIAAGDPQHFSYARLVLLAIIAAGSISLSALTWHDR